MTLLPVIFRREYVERIRSRSFLISTILTPLLLGLFSVGPAISDRVGSGGPRYHFVVVDESERAGPRVVELLGAAASRGGRVTADGGLGPVTGTRESLEQQTLGGEIAGYVWIPSDVRRSSRFELYVTSDVPPGVQREVEQAVSGAVQFARLQAAGIPAEEAALLFQPVVPETFVVESTEPEERPAAGGVGLALGVGLLLYMLILLYGTQVLHSVQEEKNNRIAEVLVASVRPMELMLGKVLGVGATALTQIAIWALLGRAIFGARGRLAALGLPTGLLDSFANGVPIPTLLTAGLYLVLGFFLYATLFAAVGAAAGSTEDAQRFTFPIIIPLFLPLFLAEAIIEDPQGRVATLLSWLPLTSPLVVPMRIGVQGVSSTTVAASLVVLLASVIGAGWVAGKISRVGILMTGSRPRIREIVRWVRMA